MISVSVRISIFFWLFSIFFPRSVSGLDWSIKYENDKNFCFLGDYKTLLNFFIKCPRSIHEISNIRDTCFWEAIKIFRGFYFTVKIEKNFKIYVSALLLKNVLNFFIDYPWSLCFLLLTRCVIKFCFNRLDFSSYKWCFIPLVVILIPWHS